jgi:hypothetical protein
MKTTGGKTRITRREARVIKIHRAGEREFCHIRKAPSFRQALLEFHRDVLKSKGFTNPRVVGNMLTVTDREGKTVAYIALEQYQTPVCS